MAERDRPRREGASTAWRAHETERRQDARAQRHRAVGPTLRPQSRPQKTKATTTKTRRSREDLPADCTLNGIDIAEAALQWRGELGYEEGAALHEGEFAAFVSYALANPTTFVALVDTYSVLDTGLRNFVTVALALAVRTRREITPSKRHAHPRDNLT